MLRTAMRIVVTVGLLTAGVVAAGPAGADEQEPPLPIVFVHGASGSAAQYETAAQRFTSNGFPAERIRGYESGAGFTIDGFIDSVRAEFGVDQVNVAAHSLGTFQMLSYLGNAAQAAKVAKYAAIDGVSAPSACVSAGNCLTISASSLGQGHTEAVSSPESFALQYQLFLGEPPATTEILPEAAPDVSGRAVNFPANTSLVGAAVRLWEVDEATGHRIGDEPDATFAIGDDGTWGPVGVDGAAHYEFNVTFPLDADRGEYHLYYQPFVRSSHLVRLNVAPTDSATAQATHSDENHTVAVVVRYREWWTSHASGANDVLTVATSSPSRGGEAPVEPLTNVSGNGTVALHLHDGESTPNQSTLALLPGYGIFQEGVDVFMPAAGPPDGTVSFTNLPRGDAANPQVVNVPNWGSDAHAVIVQFADHAQPAEPGQVAYTARYSHERCELLARVTVGLGFGSLADLVRAGVSGLADVAAAGEAVPVVEPFANDGPCAVVVAQPASEASALASAATAWGLDVDQLHHAGGQIVLLLLYIALVQAGHL